MIRRGTMFVAVLLAGCALTRGPDKPVLLHLQPHVGVIDGQRTGSIALAPVAAVGVAGQLRYAYMLPDGSLRQAATLFWEQPPTHAVEQAMLAALGGRFAVVRAPGEPAGTTRRISVLLNRFHEVAGANARAVVGLSVRETGATQEICATAPIAGPTPGDRARAFDHALAQAATAVARYAAGEAPSETGC